MPGVVGSGNQLHRAPAAFPAIGLRSIFGPILHWKCRSEGEHCHTQRCKFLEALMHHRLVAVTLTVTFLLLLTPNSQAGEDEDKKLVVGTWRTIVGTEFVFRKDGSFSDPTSKADWINKLQTGADETEPVQSLLLTAEGSVAKDVLERHLFNRVLGRQRKGGTGSVTAR